MADGNGTVIESLELAFTSNTTGAIAGINGVQQSLSRLSNTLSRLNSVTAPIVQTLRQLSSVSVTASASISTVTRSSTETTSALDNMTKTISKIGSVYKAAFTGFTAIPKAGIKLFGNLTTSILSGLGKIGERFKRIFVSRAIRAFIRAVFNGMKEGIENVYKWSLKADKTFSNTLDRLATSTQYLKNSFGALAAPLINAVVPVIDSIVDRIVDGINFVNQVISALTGSETYTAAKKVAAKWDDTDKTTKSIKKTLLSIDELNVLSENKDTKKDKTDYGSMFETRPVEMQALNVADAFKSLFAPFVEAWKREGEPTIAAAKRAFEAVKTVAEDIAKALYDAFTGNPGITWLTTTLQLLQTALGVIGDIAIAFDTAWNDDGRGYDCIASIFDMLSSVNSLLITIGESFRAAWNDGTGVQIWSNIIDIVTNCNRIVQNLADNLSAAWDNAGVGVSIWRGILNIVNTVLSKYNQMSEATKEWASEVNFEPILSAFDRLLNVLNPVVDKITGGLAWGYENILLPLGTWTIEKLVPDSIDLLSAALDLLNTTLEALKPFGTWLWENFLKPLGDWTGDIITGAIQGLTNALRGLSDWAKENPELFQKHAEGVAIFVAAWMGATAISGIVGTITTVFHGFSAFLTTFTASVGGTLGVTVPGVITGAGPAIVGALQSLAAVVAPAAAVALTIFDVAMLARMGGEWITTQTELDNAVNNELTTALDSYRMLYETKGPEIAAQWAATCYQVDTSTLSMYEGQKLIMAQVAELNHTTFDSINIDIQQALDTYNAIVQTSGTQAANDWATQAFNIKLTGDDMGANAQLLSSYLSEIASTGAADVAQLVQAGCTDVESITGSAYNAIESNTTSSMNNVKDTITSTVEGARQGYNSEFGNLIRDSQTRGRELINANKDVFDSHSPSRVFDAIGRDLVNGMDNGMGSAWGGLIDRVKSWAQNLINSVKSIFGVHSPSTVFAGIGENLDAGMEKGLNDGRGSLLATVSEISQAVGDTFSPDMSLSPEIGSVGNLYQRAQPADAQPPAVSDATMNPVSDGNGYLAQLVEIAGLLYEQSQRDRDNHIVIDGREVFNVVVKENNRAINRTGASPIRV